MNKFLVICDRIPPEHSASGRFAYEIANEMAKKCEGYLVCLSGKEKNIKTNLTVCEIIDRYGRYQAKIEKNGNKTGVFKFLGKILYKFYYFYASKAGLSDVNSHKKYIIKYCTKLIKDKNIDTLISVSNPFDIQKTAYRIVKKNPQIKWYPYMMDSNRNNAVKIGTRDNEIKILQKAEKIFIVPALLQDKDFCEDFKGKLFVADLPVIPSKVEKNNRKDDKFIFIYAGMFYKNIREPEGLFKLFEKLPQNFELHLYCGGYIEIIPKYKEILGDRLKFSGFISPDILEMRITEADFVLSIGNTVLNQVASKVYDMVAFGKPILNLYQNSDDISLEHLSKYPLCLNLSYSDDIKTANVIEKWCKENKGKFLSYDEATVNMRDKTLFAVAEKILAEI